MGALIAAKLRRFETERISAAESFHIIGLNLCHSRRPSPDNRRAIPLSAGSRVAGSGRLQRSVKRSACAGQRLHSFTAQPSGSRLRSTSVSCLKNFRVVFCLRPCCACSIINSFFFLISFPTVLSLFEVKIPALSQPRSVGKSNDNDSTITG